jgi:cobalt-zinc-cadmium efflux system outer membrane protein
MVSLSIPIFNKKYKSQTRQNELEQQGKQQSSII